MAVTMRVSEEAHRTLKEIAGERGVPMTDLLDEIIRQLKREDRLRRGNEAYARLREDPKAWAEELEERRLFEGTLMDGLEDDPWED